MLSLENICATKVLDVYCEECSDVELLEMREMSYETRVTMFEKKMLGTIIAEVLAIRFTIINDNIPPILEKLYPFSLDSLSTLPLYEDIKTVLNNEDFLDTVTFVRNLFNIAEGSGKIELLIMCIIGYIHGIALYCKQGNKFPQSIEVIKDKLLDIRLNTFPDFRINVMEYVKNNIN